MNALEIAVISAVIIFGFAAWLIARKRGADEWRRKYAEKLDRQHAAAAIRDEAAALRLTWARNRVKSCKANLAKALKAKQGGIGIARAKLNDAVNVVLKLEGASK